MEAFEDRPCKRCKKIYTPKREWQKFCSSGCQKLYWRDIYTERATINKRLEKLEEKAGIK